MSPCVLIVMKKVKKFWDREVSSLPSHLQSANVDHLVQEAQEALTVLTAMEASPLMLFHMIIFLLLAVIILRPMQVMVE